MRLHSIELSNFRNIKSASLTFSPGMNILYGKNGSGKTNLAEAVYYFAIAKSFRVRSEEKTVMDGEYSFSANLRSSSDKEPENERKSHITVQREGIKYIEHGGFSLKAGEFLGSFRAVLYTPDTPQTIIKGAPVEKRRFLDIALCQIDKSYFHALSLYNKIQRERAAVMKQRIDYAYKYYGSPSRLPLHSEEVDRFESLIKMYTEMISEPAGYVMYMRKRFTERIESHMNAFLDYIYDGKVKIRAIYKPSLSEEIKPETSFHEYGELLRVSLATCLKEDMAEGVNGYGPAKDSIVFEFNGKDVKDVASQGQTRMMGIALKFAEGTVLAEVGKERPIFILDDVMSELDRKTQMRITDVFSEYQTIVTTADSGYLDEVSSLFIAKRKEKEKFKVFTVSEGKIDEL